MKTKFRTWYKPLKGWINSIVIGEDGHIFSYTVSLEDDKGPPTHNLLYLKDEDAVIEFSTGLKDKNGKEIYEGDIVKVERCFTRPVVKDGEIHYNFMKGETEIGEIVRLYNNQPAVSYEHKRSDDFDIVYELNNYRVEVIGNIHESKDLLK